MRLLVGLGNPGPRYAGNRHNIGFMAVDAIVRRHSFSTIRERFHALTAEGTIDGEKVLALAPQTFMNDSGRAVQAAVQFFKLQPSDVIVLYDEIDLPLGKVRAKRGGGAGGHNGIRSIDSHIGTDYWRVRLGVDHPGQKELVKSYVLMDFFKEEHATVQAMLDAVTDAIPLMIAGDDGRFMNKVNLALNPPPPKAAPGAKAGS
ncbi:aminoacyl-tRNA hydrolase [Dongia sedimenti]|uniref:Peptidyl-tRNA hydrolase n=1 Tax=Dongia sedimenti TaxID=3064282 RepID=A0ABU0YQY2_9PROT|nr:aminoacyl-tRNA hydrolase [Rhodospirillaceae bacterium R-7]